MNRVGNKAGSPVAKLPVPALGGSHIYQGAGRKLRGIAIAACNRCKVDNWWRINGNLVHDCIATPTGNSDNQGNLKAAGSIVNMGWILQA